MRFAVFNPDAERREGLKALLRQIDRRARFSDAADWRGAEHAMHRFPPSLLVIDWHDGIRTGELRAFTTQHADLPVATLIDDASTPSRVRDLLAEGAHGVIRRSTEPHLIVKFLEITLLGGSHVPADVLCPVAPPLPQPRRLRPPSLPERKPLLATSLSPRQEQIMRCVHMGNTNKMIARALGISEGTVKIHLASIFQQLGAPNRAAAVAIYNGWLSDQLQVLHAPEDHTPRPVHGQHGPVPLRHRGNAAFRYPLQADDTVTELPVAAEPSPAFAGPASAEERDAAGPDDQADGS